MIDKKVEEKKPVAEPQRAGATIRYLDRPDCMEILADSITGVTFDGQTLRLEFSVTRMDDVKPNSPVIGRRSPVCRLVLQPLAAVDLINRMQQVGALAKAGVVKTTPPASGQANGER